jgi:uncharacterized repeat protein (TIGR01451 family)
VGIGYDFVNSGGSGQIGEIVIYNTALTAAEKNKIDSYLALKYGITLTGTQGISYTLSDGTPVWNADANAAYHHDVAGIAIDHGSALTQTMSRSINDDSLVTISEGSTALTDGQAFVWGNNDRATDFNVTAGSYLHMARIWRIDEEGAVYGVNVSIPDTVQATSLLVGNDPDDFSGATAYALTDDGHGSLSATVNFADGEYFTFAAGDALSLRKTAVDVNGEPLMRGDEIEYTVTVTNELGSVQSGIVITDAIPAGTTYVNGSETVISCTITITDPVVAEVEDLAGGASATLTFRVAVDEDASGQTIGNYAQAASPIQQPAKEVGPITPEGGGSVWYGPYYLPLIFKNGTP